MLRAFIAIQLSAELKRQIAQLQAQLKREALEPPGMGWVRPEAIHLTLKFLGETEEALVPKLRSVLEAAVSSVRPFTLQALRADRMSSGSGCTETRTPWKRWERCSRRWNKEPPN